MNYVFSFLFTFLISSSLALSMDMTYNPLPYRELTVAEQLKTINVSEFRYWKIKEGEFVVKSPCCPCISATFTGKNKRNENATITFHITPRSYVFDLVRKVNKALPSTAPKKMVVFTALIDKKLFKENYVMYTKKSQKKWLREILYFMQKQLALSKENSKIAVANLSHLSVGDQIPSAEYSVIVEGKHDEDGFAPVCAFDAYTLLPEKEFNEYSDYLMEEYSILYGDDKPESDNITYLPFSLADQELPKLIQLKQLSRCVSFFIDMKRQELYTQDGMYENSCDTSESA